MVDVDFCGVEGGRLGAVAASGLGAPRGSFLSGTEKGEKIQVRAPLWLVKLVRTGTVAV